jgi:hypothetical protein
MRIPLWSVWLLARAHMCTFPYGIGMAAHAWSGRTEDAVGLYEESLASQRAYWGTTDNKDVATALNNLATAYISLGRCVSYLLTSLRVCVPLCRSACACVVEGCFWPRVRAFCAFVACPRVTLSVRVFVDVLLDGGGPSTCSVGGCVRVTRFRVLRAFLRTFIPCVRHCRHTAVRLCDVRCSLEEAEALLLEDVAMQRRLQGGALHCAVLC